MGATATAAVRRNPSDTIVGMLNLDMIAYTAGLATQDLEVMGDNWLVDRFIADAAAYVPGLLTEAWYGNYYGSDHYYFHSSQYPGSSSLFGIEDTANDIWGGSNPYYHKTTDTADRLDYGFAYKVTQASAATLADLAGLIPEPPIMLLLLSGLLLAARGRRGEVTRRLNEQTPDDARRAQPGRWVNNESGTS